MASSKKAQGKAGLPAQRRGQQMGDARSTGATKQDDSKTKTPPARGRRKDTNKFYADDSAQAGGDAARPRNVSPSVPAALPTGHKLGEPGVEKVAKLRQSKARTATKKKA